MWKKHFTCSLCLVSLFSFHCVAPKGSSRSLERVKVIHMCLTCVCPDHTETSVCFSGTAVSGSSHTSVFQPQHSSDSYYVNSNLLLLFQSDVHWGCPCPGSALGSTLLNNHWGHLKFRSIILPLHVIVALLYEELHIKCSSFNRRSRSSCSSQYL